jgi:spore germination protein YaaH
VKIALCLHGLVGKTRGKVDERPSNEPQNDPKIAFNQYKHHFFDKNDSVDTFLHIRDLDYEQSLLELYKPKKYLSEPFVKPDTEHLLVGNAPIQHQRRCSQSMWSRFYSFQKAVEQKTAYEQEQGFKYDFVFVSRYDLAMFEDFTLSNYDPNYFYAPFSGWMFYDRAYFVGESIPDLWFFSSSDQINEFSKIYDDLERYSKDLADNCISPHFAISNKLRESDTKLRFVLNMDVDFTNHNSNRVGLTRYLHIDKYWGYNKEQQIYFVKPEYKAKLNKSEYDMDWSIYGTQKHWDIYNNG